MSLNIVITVFTISWFLLFFGQYWINRRPWAVLGVSLCAALFNTLVTGMFGEWRYEAVLEFLWQGFMFGMIGVLYIILFGVFALLGWVQFDETYRLWGGRKVEPE